MTTPPLSAQSDSPARLERELSVLWQYDGPDGYQWRARRGASSHAGCADTETDAWLDGLAWLSTSAASDEERRDA